MFKPDKLEKLNKNLLLYVLICTNRLSKRQMSVLITSRFLCWSRRFCGCNRGPACSRYSCVAYNLLLHTKTSIWYARTIDVAVTNLIYKKNHNCWFKNENMNSASKLTRFLTWCIWPDLSSRWVFISKITWNFLLFLIIYTI